LADGLADGFPDLTSPHALPTRMGYIQFQAVSAAQCDTNISISLSSVGYDLIHSLPNPKQAQLDLSCNRLANLHDGMSIT
jgi:hypothetical protein